jgi:predicted ribosome-associated RNA-binding protein Tma20
VRLTSRHALAFVTATLTHRGTTIEIPDVVVDTGAASTVIDGDHAAKAGIYLEPADKLRRLRGVGGHEHVFVRKIDRFAAGGAVWMASRLRWVSWTTGFSWAASSEWTSCAQPARSSTLAR